MMMTTNDVQSRIDALRDDTIAMLRERATEIAFAQEDSTDAVDVVALRDVLNACDAITRARRSIGLTI